MRYTVYKHTVPNGKVYIGITSVDVNKRWLNGRGYKDNKHFYRDIVLYGWLNIKHEIILKGLTEAEARYKEAKLIYEHQSYKKNYGYNKVAGLNYGFIEKNTKSREEYLMYCKTEEYRKNCIPKNSKPVSQYKLDGTYIKTYPSIREASRMLKVDKKCIYACIKGKQKTCKGFIFKCDKIPSPPF